MWAFELPPTHSALLVEAGALWLKPGPPPCMCAWVELPIWGTQLLLLCSACWKRAVELPWAGPGATGVMPGG